MVCNMQDINHYHQLYPRRSFAFTFDANNNKKLIRRWDSEHKFFTTTSHTYYKIQQTRAERGGATSDGHQAMRPHLTSSVTFALVVSEATGRLQTGHFGLQVAARRNPFVSRRWLRAPRWIRTPSSALGRCQRSQCTVNLQSALRQEFFGGGTESMEQ